MMDALMPLLLLIGGAAFGWEYRMIWEAWKTRRGIDRHGPVKTITFLGVTYRPDATDREEPS